MKILDIEKNMGSEQVEREIERERDKDVCIQLVIND